MSVAEAPVALVWNKGIARLCDRRIPDEFPDGLAYRHASTLAGGWIKPKLPTDLISDPARHADIREGEIVWVRLAWLPAFVHQVLPLIRARFVLATGDSDSSVPSEVPAELARTILASPKVMRWFTQNHDGGAPERIAPLPIGIDFHSVSEHPMWSEAVASPSEQESVLTAILADLAPRERRDPRLYIDFAWHGRRQGYRVLAPARLKESRRAVVKRLRRRDVVVCQETSLPRSEVWRRRGAYAAALSLHGGGLDSHRTWEALALGHLVVVPTSPLDPLFDGLPVVPVSSWGEITAPNLARWLLEAADHTYASERLTSRYWVERMRAVAGCAGA